MTKFLSCDWGTTNFRLRLVDANDLSIKAETTNDQGIAAVYSAWKKTGGDREKFYASILLEASASLAKTTGQHLKGLPLLISGMASSSLGLRELPYARLPFAADGKGAHTEIFTMQGLDHQIMLVSGLQTPTDVMRGEETQWLGLMGDDLLKDKDELLVILPGTHSKHISVQQRAIIDFKTYMTGEFFNLLIGHSVLKNSVEAGSLLQDDIDKVAFTAGVRASLENDLLHQSFLVRTNDLFQKYSKKQNTSYLSGMLIGTELQNINTSLIALAAGSTLLQAYQLALEILGHTGKMIIFSAEALDRALIKGQLIIFNQNKANR